MDEHEFVIKGSMSSKEIKKILEDILKVSRNSDKNIKVLKPSSDKNDDKPEG